MTTLYWQVYKNLEREFLQVADVVHVDDTQLGVYSMKIADLLTRTVVEIEAISKELYLSNGGAVVPDDEMYFDTVCMKHLDELWKLDKKVVLVVSPSIYIEDKSNRVLRPLHKASKRGTSSASWNRAYQAVKHNRVKELSKGNISNLLQALAALYVLNLYYKDTQLQNVSQTEENNVDCSFGSELFAIKLHVPDGLTYDGTYRKTDGYDECVYICEFEPESMSRSLEALRALNDYTNTATQSILETKINERLAQGLEVTDEWARSVRIEAMNDIYPIKDYRVLKLVNENLGAFKYDIVLNKQQH